MSLQGINEGIRHCDCPWSGTGSATWTQIQLAQAVNDTLRHRLISLRGGSEPGMEVKREGDYQRLGRCGQLGSILVYFSVTMIKHSDQKHFRVEKGCMAYRRLSLRTETQAENQSKDYRGRLPSSLLPMACSTCFPIKSRTTNPGIPSPTMVWAIPHWSRIEKMTYIQILWRHFSQLRFLPLK